VLVAVAAALAEVVTVLLADVDLSVTTTGVVVLAAAVDESDVLLDDVVLISIPTEPVVGVSVVCKVAGGVVGAAEEDPANALPAAEDGRIVGEVCVEYVGRAVEVCVE
jgi:hypothetical protein